MNIIQSAWVSLEYTLIDSDSTKASIVVRYSTDGSNYSNATEATIDPDTGKTSDGTENLDASPTGVTHRFVWDSLADVCNGTFDTVYIEITATDAEGHTGAPAKVSFTLANTPPEVEIIPLSGTYSGTLIVAYKLRDEASDNASIVVEFSTDGTNFSPTTEANNIYSDGTTDLSTSPSGLTHLFFWETLTDIGAKIESSVYLRITPSDSQGTGEAKVTGPFTIDNDLLPYAEIVTPSGTQSGPVTISYILHDKNSSSIDITVEYSLDDGATYNTATIESTDEGTISGNQILGLSSSPGGVLHSFVWNSSIDADKMYSSKCRIRVLPYNGVYYGPWTTTNNFVLSNNEPPACVMSNVTGVKTGNILLYFMLTDVELDRCSIQVYYSPDDGANFFPATLSSGATTNLPSNGSRLWVYWNSSVDLGTVFLDTVKFKIVPYDFPDRAGTPGVTNTFVVDNTVWSAIERVTVNTSNESRNPAVAVSSDCIPCVLFEDNRGGDWEIYWAKKVGANWQVQRFIGSSGVDDTQPDCVVDSKGWLCGTWVSAGKSVGYWMVRVSDGYWNIANLKWLSSGSSDVAEPSIGIDPSDNIYVLWADKSSGKFEIYMRVRDSAGEWYPATSSPPLKISDSKVEARSPKAVFSNGVLHIVWQDKNDGDWETFYNTYNPSSGAIGTPLKLTDNNKDDLSPCIAAGGDGKLYVTYSRNESGNFDIFRRIYDGTTWQTGGMVLDRPRDAQWIRSAMLFSALNLVWYENDGTRDQIWFSYGIGSAWSFQTPVNISQTNPGDARFPDIASDTNGSLHIVYQCNRYGKWEIFYRKR